MRSIVFFVSLLATICSWAQPTGLAIRRATGPIAIDGVMNEPDWAVAEVASQFMQYFPFDSSQARAQTAVRMTYDDHFIYLFAIMYNTKGPRKYITPSLRRDFRGEANDSFVVSFDTYMDNTNAFQFGINPFGVQREGLISNGGSNSDDLSLNWDNKWFSEARILDSVWVCEFAIPFKSIRYKSGLSQWNVNFYRIDSHHAERSTWTPIPRVYPLVTLAFLRKLNWDVPLHSPGQNVSLIPYTAYRATKDYDSGLPSKSEFTGGGDAKIAVSSAMNLDLTVNPDFSQVEVDQQVTNLDRFEIFFPERRQFFLENADLFANFGSEGAFPFFSRRIGVARDTATGQNIQNTIYAGARLSGKINNNLRVGLMTMQAGKDVSIGLPSTNYSVLSFQQKVFARSNIGLIFINKQAVSDSLGGEFTFSPKQYNRVLGVDYNLLSRDNRWTGKFYYHQSFDEAKEDSTFSAGSLIRYATNWFESEWMARSIGAHFNPEVGFVRRTDIRQLASTSWINYYPDSRHVQSHGPGFDFDLIGNEKFGFLDWDVNLMYRVRFKNTAFMNIRLRKEYTYLFNPFDPSGSGGLELPAGTSYNPYVFIANFTSDARKKVYTELNTRSGQYYNGYRMNLTGRISYRFQPLGVISMDFSYNGIRLPKPYNSSDLFLIGPRVDLTFSRNVFWTTFVQYNSQIQNLNINSRLQWRFAPVSDLFIVYTDNYFAETNIHGDFFYIGQPKLRSITLKLTYWFNL
ncbi:MAG: carbohydrate binding family 9 domain-containing protein [Cyclobacteriaceae bacterium]|nr:carbohydrate binding family 9 domain-containing protein [Cyclobacteriaceae bacterium]